jgi:hypothetical protein
MTAAVIVVCPCCASPLDAQPGPQEQTFECVCCGQSWSMVIDPDRLAEYSLT